MKKIQKEKKEIRKKNLDGVPFLFPGGKTAGAWR
jgi:hypothetical protein